VGLKESSLAFLYAFNGMDYAGYQLDYVFDWTISKYPQIGSSSRPRPTPRPALDPPGPPAERAEKPTGTLMFSVSYIGGTNTKRYIKKFILSCKFMRQC
jgi:hypothetical protein